MSLAKAFVTGTVVKAPEKRFTQNDLAIASFSLNIDESTGTILRVSAFGQQAENVGSQVNEGDTVAVDGRLQTNQFSLPNGTTKRVYEIIASNVEKIKGSSNIQAKPSQNEDIVSFNDDEIAQDLINEDEIPF